MARLKQNIWIIYIVFLLGGSLLAGKVALIRWSSIVDHYEQQHIHRAEQVAYAVKAVFSSHEMLLDVLGQQLLREHTDLTIPQSPQLLDELLQINPTVLGFGLARPDGQLVLVNSSQNKKLLPNLLTQKTSRDSFQQALNSDVMVPGRTYYLHALGDWGIPLRKALRNDQGEAIAVMTAGIHISGTSKIFEKDLHYGESDEVSLVRSDDFYLQYHSSSHQELNRLYNTPVTESLIDSSIAALMKAADTDFYGLLQLDKATPYRFERNGAERIAAAIYDPRYKLWIMSSVEFDEVLDEFFPEVIFYSLIFLIVQIMVFVLFRYVAIADQSSRKKLEYQAAHDVLTRLPNRHYLIEQTQHLIDVGVEQFSLFFIDVDNFKGVNDNYGHDLGDSILIELAHRLEALTKNDELLARLGGDEFVLITPLRDKKELADKAQQIIEVVSQSFELRNLQFHLGASIGIASYPHHGNNLNDLLRAADIAMYEAKKEKNSVVSFRGEIENIYMLRNRIEQHLRRAINNNELFMCYQPQVDQSGRLVGVEALVRWKNQTLGMVPPDQFIPVAENSGLMPDIGHFIIEQSLKEIQELRLRQNNLFNLSLNISVRQLLQPDFVALLCRQVASYQFSPHEIVLEITENLFMENMAQASKVIFELRNCGFNISLDDFGTGHSSLSVLQKLPIDELKVDKSFVEDISSDEKARKMIKNVIAIGKNYGMSVLAEGVETELQMQALVDFGCDYFQGYWFSRPLDIEALDTFVADQADSEDNQALVSSNNT